MTVPLLGSGVLLAAEFLVNNLLALDPHGRRRLLSEAGTRLSVMSTSPALSLTILITENGLHLGNTEEESDIVVKGGALDLLQLLTQKNMTAVLRESDISITGDMVKAQSLQHTLGSMKLDWEFHLSKVIGDIPTQAIRDGLDQGRSLANDNLNSLIGDLDEYLHEEKNLFPDQSSMENFYDAIDSLRLNVDRLSARIRQLGNL